MSRFDSLEHLDRWRATGRFPRIHDGITALVRSTLPKWAQVADLGSSTGLLTRRLAEHGYEVCGVEADARAIALGEEYGTYGEECPVHPFEVTPDTLADLEGLLAGTDAVVARRVLPELLDNQVTPAMVGEVLAEAGVRWIVLEGRAPRAGATHKLAHLGAEIAGLESAGWRVADRAGSALAVMVPTG